MDFASVSTLGNTIFSTTDSGLNWLYSGSLITVCVASVLFTGIMQRWKRGGNWAVMGLGVIGNVTGGWARWYSVRQGSYTTAMMSSVLLGVAGAAIIVSIVPLAKHNFSEEQKLDNMCPSHLYVLCCFSGLRTFTLHHELISRDG